MTHFGPGGQALWDEITSQHELTQVQVVQLTEACRQKDRLDQLDALLRGDVSTWVEIDYPEGKPARLVVNAALDKANATANVMKQLLASLRLPDANGKRPQQRGGARGSYGGQVPGGAASDGKVSSIDRARNRRGA